MKKSGPSISKDHANVDERMSDLEDSYRERLPVWEALREEVDYAISQAVTESALKIHMIESRVKELKSIIGKSEAKGISDPFHNLTDIVGVRVITLFRRNLDDIEKLISTEFELLSKDDKTEAVDSALGYQSIHYICKINSGYIGPRYKKVSNISFEIQVRTLCMHAWSVVSHYLDYKGDWDVPVELKKSLQALSGLFYVADNQFEQFAADRANYKLKSSEQLLNNDESKEEVNLDTMTLYLGNKFPDRNQSSEGDISQLVRQLEKISIKRISQLNAEIDAAAPEIDKLEAGRGKMFTALGVARISLGLRRAEYRDIQYEGKSLAEVKKMFSYG